MAKQEFLSKSGLYIYDEELKQYLEEQFGSGISEALVDANDGNPIYIWVGTKEEYTAIETKLENCLYILTDDTESVEFENTSNKVTEINDNANNISYPTTLAVKTYMSNISGYEKTSNKVTTISNASTDEGYTSPLSVYTLVQNEVNAAKNTILLTVEDRVLNVEKQSNKVTEITKDAKHTTYPSSRAVFDAIKTYGGTDIKTTDVIDKNSTSDEIPNAKATYDFVKSEINSINKIIQSQTPTIYSGASEPDASVGKVGDLWVVIE